MPTVAVFFGGRSNEWEISVITGMYAVNLLRGSEYRVIPVFLPPTGGMCTGKFSRVSDFSGGTLHAKEVTLAGRSLRIGRKRVPFDVALNCCHGGMGEDGTLAALLAWNKVPTASPGVTGSAVAMDKWVCKLVARGLDIPVLPALCLRRGEEGEVPFPAVVKPLRLGSSIGLSVVRSREELTAALETAYSLDDAVLLERYLPGKRDVNCAALRVGEEIRLSPCEEVFSGEELLSFGEKYLRTRGHKLPAQLPANVADQIAACTRRLYAALDLKGVVRMDFLVSGEEVYFNELNAVPGSLAAYLFAPTLAGVRGFLLSLLDEARSKEQPQREPLTTGILRESTFQGAKGCKRRGNFV